VRPHKPLRAAAWHAQQVAQVSTGARRLFDHKRVVLQTFDVRKKLVRVRRVLVYSHLV